MSEHQEQVKLINWCKLNKIFVCTICKKEKDYNEFPIDDRKKYKIRMQCKICRNSTNKKKAFNRKKKLNPNYEIPVPNKEICKICDKEFGIKPSQVIKKGNYCSRKCYSISMKKSLRGKLNPNYKHGKSNTKEYSKEHNQKRRAIRNKVKTSLSFSNIALILNNTSTCYWCRKKIKNEKCLDHYIPLARGGSNELDNIVVSCRSCNAKKHCKDPIQFANENGRLL